MHVTRLSTGAATAVVVAAVQLLAFIAGQAGAFHVIGSTAAGAVSVARGSVPRSAAASHVLQTHHHEHDRHHHHNVNTGTNAILTSSYSMATRPMTALHCSTNNNDNYNRNLAVNSGSSSNNELNSSRRSGEISRSSFCSRTPTPPPPTTQTTAMATASAYRDLTYSSFSSPPPRPNGRRGGTPGRLSMMASGGGGGGGGKGDGGGGGKGPGRGRKKGESVQNRALATVVSPCA